MSAALEVLPDGAMQQLIAFKREVEAALPDQVTGVTLFGSRARGDAQHDSDYDVAVFVRDRSDRPEIRHIVSEAAFSHFGEDFYISAIVLPADYLAKVDRHELAGEIARDGIALP